MSISSFAVDRGFTTKNDITLTAPRIIAKDTSPCFNDKVAVLTKTGSRYSVIYSTDALISYNTFDLDVHVDMADSGDPLCTALPCETLELTDIVLLDSGFVVDSSVGILFLRFETFGLLTAELLRRPVGTQRLRLAKNTVCVDSDLLHQTRFAVYAMNENLGEIAFSSGKLQFIDGNAAEQLVVNVETFRMSDGATFKLDRLFLHRENASFVAQLSGGQTGGMFFAEFIRGKDAFEEVTKLTELGALDLQAHASGLAVFAFAQEELWISHAYGGSFGVSSLHFRKAFRTETPIIGISSCGQSSEFFVETAEGAVFYGKVGSPQVIKAADVPSSAIFSCTGDRQVYAATLHAGPSIHRSTVALFGRLRNSKRPLAQALFVPSGRIGSFQLSAAPFPFQPSDTGKNLMFQDTRLHITDVNEEGNYLQVFTRDPLPIRVDKLSQNDLLLTFLNDGFVELISNGNGLARLHEGMTVLALEGAILIRRVWNSSLANGIVVYPVARLGVQVVVRKGEWHLVDLRR